MSVLLNGVPLCFFEKREGGYGHGKKASKKVEKKARLSNTYTSLEGCFNYDHL